MSTFALPRRFAWRGGTSATLVATVLAIVVWQTATLISGGWVPSVDEIAHALWQDVRDPNVYDGMLITFRRILIAFAAATLIGIALGVGMGLSRHVHAFFRPIVVLSLAIPDPVYIILAVLVLGTEESSGLVALTIALVPFVVNIVLSGVGARDRGLDEMGRVYRLQPHRYVVDVVLRQVAPSLIAATRTSFNFAWKLVVLVEAMTQPDGVGAQIYYAFRLLQPAHMISLALMFIVFLRLVETLTFRPVERRLTAWR